MTRENTNALDEKLYRGKAETCLMHALNLDPDFLPGLLHFAEFQRATKRFPNAEKIYAHILTLEEVGYVSVRTLISLGNLYSDWGRNVDALACFTEALRLEPAEHPDPKALRGHDIQTRMVKRGTALTSWNDLLKKLNDLHTQNVEPAGSPMAQDGSPASTPPLTSTAPGNQP